MYPATSYLKYRFTIHYINYSEEKIYYSAEILGVINDLECDYLFGNIKGFQFELITPENESRI